MTNQYWADGSTKNCVWLFQVMSEEYGEGGCTCGFWDHEKGCKNENMKECTCSIKVWRTEGVFLTKKEAREHGEARPYAWGDQGKGWRIYGVQSHGIMVELLGQHNKEFEKEVEYISKYKEDVEE